MKIIIIRILIILFGCIAFVVQIFPTFSQFYNSYEQYRLFMSNIDVINLISCFLILILILFNEKIAKLISNFISINWIKFDK